jgi:hypothetical protein
MEVAVVERYSFESRSYILTNVWDCVTSAKTWICIKHNISESEVEVKDCGKITFYSFTDPDSGDMYSYRITEMPVCKVEFSR